MIGKMVAIIIHDVIGVDVELLGEFLLQPLLKLLPAYNRLTHINGPKGRHTKGRLYLT